MAQPPEIFSVPFALNRCYGFFSVVVRERRVLHRTEFFSTPLHKLFKRREAREPHALWIETMQESGQGGKLKAKREEEIHICGNLFSIRSWVCRSEPSPIVVEI